MFLFTKSTTYTWWKVQIGQMYTVKRRSLSLPRLPSFKVIQFPSPETIAIANVYVFFQKLTVYHTYISIDRSIYLSIYLSSRSFILTQKRACMTSPLPLLRPPTWLCTLETVSKGKLFMGSFISGMSSWDSPALEKWKLRLGDCVEKGNRKVEPLNERRSLDSRLLRLYPSASFFLLFSQF